MRFYSSLAAANLIVLCSLIFTCGCQNEPAATKKPATPPQVAHTSPPEAKALDGSDQNQEDSIESAFKREALVRDAFNQDSVGLATWEEDIPQDSRPAHETVDLMVDSSLDLESDDLQKLNVDTSRTNVLLKNFSDK